MNADEIETRELEALYDEKRDKLSSRLPVWSLLIGLFSLFGYAGIQPGIAGYVVVLYPLLSACVARFAGHNERILDRVKRRIYQIEERAGYHGYEHDNASHGSGSGGHSKALRDVIILTDLVALTALVARLLLDHVPALVLPLLLVEIAALAAACVWLYDQPSHQAPRRESQESQRHKDVLRKSAAVTVSSVTTAASGQQERRRPYGHYQ